MNTVFQIKNLVQNLGFYNVRSSIVAQKVVISVFDFLTSVTYYVRSGSKSGTASGTGSGTGSRMHSDASSAKAESSDSCGSDSTTYRRIF
jgi:hypothetical protein